MKAQQKKSNNKFRLVLVDVNTDSYIAKAMNVQHAPQMFLVYRQNVAQEIRFLNDSKENKEAIKEMIKSSIFFYNVAQEEQQLNSLIQLSKQHIEEKSYEEAINLLEEAYKFEKWKEIYGSTILSNLAYSSAMMGNSTKAKHYLKEYNRQFGDPGYEMDEQQLLDAAQQISDQIDIGIEKEKKEKQQQQDEEKQKQKESDEINVQKHTIEDIQNLIQQYMYQEAIDICLDMLTLDYNNDEIHIILLQTFSELGSNNELVQQSRQLLKDIMISKKLF